MSRIITAWFTADRNVLIKEGENQEGNVWIGLSPPNYPSVLLNIKPKEETPACALVLSSVLLLLFHMSGVTAECVDRGKTNRQRRRDLKR